MLRLGDVIQSEVFEAAASALLSQVDLCLDRVGHPLRVMQSSGGYLVNGVWSTLPATAHEIGAIAELLAEVEASEFIFDQLPALQDIAQLAEFAGGSAEELPESMQLGRADGAGLETPLEDMTQNGRAIRMFATAVVLMRQLHDAVRRGDYSRHNLLDQAADVVVNAAALHNSPIICLGANADDDAATTSVRIALLSSSAVQQLGAETSFVRRTAACGLAAGLGQTRLAAGPVGAGGAAAPRLDSASVAALCGGGSLDGDAPQRLLDVWECHGLLGHTSGGRQLSAHEASRLALLVATAHRLVDAIGVNTPDTSPEILLSALAKETPDNEWYWALTTIAGRIGATPVGSLVELTTNWQGVVTQLVPGRQPELRLLRDPFGRNVKPAKLKLDEQGDADEYYGELRRVVFADDPVLLKVRRKALRRAQLAVVLRHSSSGRSGAAADDDDDMDITVEASLPGTLGDWDPDSDAHPRAPKAPQAPPMASQAPPAPPVPVRDPVVGPHDIIDFSLPPLPEIGGMPVSDDTFEIVMAEDAIIPESFEMVMASDVMDPEALAREAAKPIPAGPVAVKTPLARIELGGRPAKANLTAGAQPATNALDHAEVDDLLRNFIAEVGGEDWDDEPSVPAQTDDPARFQPTATEAMDNEQVDELLQRFQPSEPSESAQPGELTADAPPSDANEAETPRGVPSVPARAPAEHAPADRVQHLLDSLDAGDGSLLSTPSPPAVTAGPVNRALRFLEPDPLPSPASLLGTPAGAGGHLDTLPTREVSGREARTLLSGFMPGTGPGESRPGGVGATSSPRVGLDQQPPPAPLPFPELPQVEGAPGDDDELAESDPTPPGFPVRDLIPAEALEPVDEAPPRMAVLKKVRRRRRRS